MGTVLLYLLILICAVTTVFHFVSIAVVAQRLRRPGIGQSGAVPPVTLLRPISALDPYLQETLTSSFTLTAPEVDIIFCASHELQPAVRVARTVMAAHPHRPARLLIGDDRVSQNPKLNNCLKGWRAAKHDHVLMVDSNVLLPPDYVQQMMSAWDGRTGLVSAPPIGDHSQGLPAVLECSFLNTFQAKWQLFADQLGYGFAQGKNLLFRKSIIDGAGGLELLGREPAEDAAATVLVRSLGLKVRLAHAPFPQPLGQRSLSNVWDRQVRWARLRRATFPAFYLPEILAGSLPAVISAVIALTMLGYNPWPFAFGLMALWFGAEMLLARLMRWRLNVSMPLCMLARDLMLPLIWCIGLVSRNFEWQGHRMTADRDEFDVPQPEFRTS